MSSSVSNKKTTVKIATTPISDEEKVLFKKYFAEVFLFGKKGADVFKDFSEKAGCSRQRAKEIFWIGIHRCRSGYFFKYHHDTREQLITLAKLYKDILLKQGVNLTVQEIVLNVEEMVYEKQQRLQQEKKNKGVN